jgi:hypothetical protein
MKKKIADEWVKALRSGKYRQGKKALKFKSKRGVTRHCCLGVLCELYQKEHKRKLKVEPRSPDPDDDLPKYSKAYKFEDSWETLPEKVMMWAGMDSDEGFLPSDHYDYGYEGSQTLAELNDNGCPFREIADTIAKDWEEISTTQPLKGLGL